jgi:hypothetical protein
MNWSVYCPGNQYNQFVQEVRGAGFTIQLHADTLDRWENGPVAEYRLVISHQCESALTLFLLRSELNLRVADD